MLKGLWLVLKNMFRKPVTIQYPEERVHLAERFRGRQFLRDDKCIGCHMCAEVCPEHCITMIEKDPEGKDIPRPQHRPAIDYSICMFCNLCVDICPVDALLGTKIFEMPEVARNGLRYSPERLGTAADFSKVKVTDKRAAVAAKPTVTLAAPVGVK